MTSSFWKCLSHRCRGRKKDAQDLHLYCSVETALINDIEATTATATHFELSSVGRPEASSFNPTNNNNNGISPRNQSALVGYMGKNKRGHNEKQDDSTAKEAREVEEEQDVPQQEEPKTRLTEKDVYDFIWSYCEEFTEVAQYPMGRGSSLEAWNAFWAERHAADYILVRPSGNMVDLEGYKQMFEKGVIREYSDQVVAVESIKLLLGGRVATAVYKSDQEFIYEGNKSVEDFATWTVVIVLQDGKPKITNLHRCTGKRINDIYK